VRERTDGNHLGAGFAERIEQAQLGRHRNRGTLDLQPFAHGVVGDDHGFRQEAHGGWSWWMVERVGCYGR